METLTATVDYRKRALRTLAQLPPFSPILQRLMATLAREDISFMELARIIEKDTVLAGNVLRLVNSALYGRRATVTSVAHGVAILGTSKLRNYALGMSITTMLNRLAVPRGWSSKAFNLHSVGTAMLADFVALRADVESPECAFAAGLFHDMGKLLIASSLPDEFLQIYTLYQHGEGAIEACERAVLSFDHSELSAEAMRHWNLPAPVCEAVGRHHQATPEKPPFALAAVIGTASAAVTAAGFAVEPVGTPVETDPSAQLQSMLSPEDIEEAMAQVDLELHALKSFL